MLAQRRLQRDLETLHGALKTLMHDTKEMGIEKVGAAVGEISERTTEQLSGIVNQVEESIGQFRKQIRESSEMVETTIKNHPYAFIGAAVGVGYLLGQFVNLERQRAN